PPMPVMKPPKTRSRAIRRRLPRAKSCTRKLAATVVMDAAVAVAWGRAWLTANGAMATVTPICSKPLCRGAPRECQPGENISLTTRFGRSLRISARCPIRPGDEMRYHQGWKSRAALVVIALLCCSFAASGQDRPAGWDMQVCADPNDLPYSNKAKEGFENRIAEILADELGADLSYVWYPRRRKFVQHMLRAGRCDLVMGVSDSSSKMLTTLAYYRSSYVFVYPEDAALDITSFDDPELKQLRIGVQMGGGLLPPNKALANRGMTENLEGYPIVGDYDEDQPLSPIIKA